MPAKVCRRCGGKCFFDLELDPYSLGEAWAPAYWCINCGRREYVTIDFSTRRRSAHETAEIARRAVG